VVRTEMQYVLHQRRIELRTRSMSHLLSSVDPVLYCDTDSRADCFIACFVGCFSVCFFVWVIADCALHYLASQRMVHSLSVHYCSSCVAVGFIQHASLRAVILSILASNATDPANHHQWINRESSMHDDQSLSTMHESAVVHFESIVNQ
jgi:hypothetical protein